MNYGDKMSYKYGLNEIAQEKYNKQYDELSYSKQAMVQQIVDMEIWSKKRMRYTANKNKPWKW